MPYFKYIKNNFYVYIISGIIFGVSVFTLIIIHRYNNYLATRLAGMEYLINNKEKIKKQIRDMDALADYLKEEFNIDTSDINSDEHIFRVLDDMQENLQNAALTFTGIEGSGKNNSVTVEIEAPVNNYSMLVSYVQYLESFTMPRFRIMRFSVAKRASGGMELNIKGELMMPSLYKGDLL